jgi:5-methylcytosine-specific restriction enzyme A
LSGGWKNLSNPFYRSTKWKKKRERILKRDKYLCQECLKYGRNTEANVVHHIIEIEDEPGLKLESTNLVSVCRSCHNKIHPEKGGYRVRY